MGRIHRRKAYREHLSVRPEVRPTFLLITAGGLPPVVRSEVENEAWWAVRDSNL